MLDSVERKNFNDWAKGFLSETMNLRTSNSEEDMAHNRKQFEKIDLILKLAIPLVATTPVIISTGYLRYTFSLRHVLPHWQLLLEETNKQFCLKYKPEKAKALLRGLNKENKCI